MTQRFASAIGAAAIVALIGCGGTAPSTPPVKLQAASKTERKAVPEVRVSPARLPAETVAQRAPAKADSAAATPPSETPISSASDSESKKALEKTKNNDRSGVERLAILTPGGPLLIDVRLTIDGRPYAEGFDKRVESVLDAADADDDGQPTWAELIANSTYLSSVGAGKPNVNARQRKMWIEQYDLDEDGRVQPAEAGTWLGRDSGRAARAFALRSNRSYLPDPRLTSRIWQLLDADRDGVLAMAELGAAPDSLLALDADDDQVITPAELVSLRDELSAADGRMAPAAHRNSSHYAAIHLEPEADIARLEYLLNDMYAPRQDLSPASFSEFTRLGEELDANGDAWLEREELAEMLNTPPYAELSVAFAPAAPGKSGVTVQVERHAPELSASTEGMPDRLVLQSGGTRLIVAAQDIVAPPVGPQPGMQAADRSQLRAMVHDQCDALFEELDANADGRLGAPEMASCAARLLERDANRDGQLTADELPSFMVIGFVRGEPAGEQSFYIPARSTPPIIDATVAPWFRQADFNSDGYLSRREFLGSAEQFTELDRSGDGFIDGSEAAAAGSD